MITRALRAMVGLWEDGQSATSGGWLWSQVHSRRTSAGNEVSPSSALALPVYFACLRVIGEDVAKLPLHVYRRQRDGSRVQDDGVSVARLLRLEPNPEISAFGMREMLTIWAAGWGNGCAEIIRDSSGTPVALNPIHPARINIRRNDDGDLRFRVRNVPGTPGPDEYVELAPEDVLHIRGPGDNVVGWSIAQIAAESLGLSLAGQQFAATFYGNGASLGGIIKHPDKLSDVARANMRDSWNAMHRGAQNAHKVAIFEEGADYVPTAVNPRDAQFIEGRQFQVEEVCRWFRMPPHKVQHLLRATFSNIEHQGIEYVTDTLMPWLTRWESEIQRKLFPAGDRFAEHDVKGLLRGDATARGAFYSQLFQVGALSPNDIRRAENLDPIDGDGGDSHFVQGALVPLDRAANPPEPTPAPTKPAPAPAAEPGKDEQ